MCGPISHQEYESVIDKKEKSKHTWIKKCDFSISSGSSEIQGDLYISLSSQKLYLAVSLDDITMKETKDDEDL